MSLAAALAATITAGLLVILTDTRARLAILAIQYGAIGLLVGGALPVGVAAAKVAAGLAATAILATSTVRGSRSEATRRMPPEEKLHPLHAVAVGLVGIAALALGGRSWSELPALGGGASLGAAALLALGLLQVGVSQGPLRVGIGLMTSLSGFEIAYSYIEPSLVVTALLGSTHLGIALVVSYLIQVIPLDEVGEEAELR